MNIKKLGISVIVVFIFIFGYEFLFHGILLKDLYLQTSDLWRPESEMKNYFPWAIANQFIAAILISVIYFQKHENKGLKEGLRFGVLFGVLLGIVSFGFYAYMPIPFSLAIFWLIGSVVELICIGIILSLVNLSKS